MSSQKFETLDEDIEELLDKVSKRLELSENASDAEIKRTIQQLDMSLEEAKYILNRMENESRMAPARFQSRMKSKIAKYTEEIQRNKKKINDLRYKTVKIVGGGFISEQNTHPEDGIRDQILAAASSLDRTSQSIARTQTVAIETEQLGTEVLGELATQREALERARERLGDTQEGISRSRKVLNSLRRHFLYNKCLLIVIIILEALILAGLVYWKFFT